MRVRIALLSVFAFVLNLLLFVGTALAGNDPPWPP
jgi:hypothetical protein